MRDYFRQLLRKWLRTCETFKLTKYQVWLTQQLKNENGALSKILVHAESFLKTRSSWTFFWTRVGSTYLLIYVVAPKSRIE